MRRNESEIRRKMKINTAMMKKATSEDTIPATVLRFFLTHRTPGQRTIDIPNMLNDGICWYFMAIHTII